LLHRDDGVPVEQRWFDPEEQEIVSSKAVHKAAVLPDGRLIEVTPEDLEQIQPPPSREIEVLAFVPIEAIEAPYFERPYYLGPDAKSDELSALIKLLAEKRLVGIARWVMRKKHYLGAITSDGNYLAMVTLRPSDEVVSAEELPAPSGPPLKKKELDLAKQLVDSLEGQFDPSEFADMYTESALKLIAERAKKHTVAPFGGKPARTHGGSLEELLKQSLEKKAPKHKTKVSVRRTRGRKSKKRSA